MALYLSLRNSIKASPNFLGLRCLFCCASWFDSNGELCPRSAWVLVLCRRHGTGGGKTRHQTSDVGGGGGRGGERVRLPCGSPLSLHRLLHSSAYNRHDRSYRQVPPLLPHASAFPLVQEEFPVNANPIVSDSRTYSALLNMDLGFRCFCTGTHDSVECEDEFGSEDDNDGDDEDGEIGDDCVNSSSADPKELEKVCKVIDELFALDRNMETVLDELGVNLSHDLVVEVLYRFRHARKPAFRFFCWAGDKPGFAHDSRTYNSMMSILAKTRQFETMVSLLEEMGDKRLLTMETFTTAMKAFAAAKERKKAVGIFELMKKYKFKIGVETINCLLDSLGRAKLGKEAQILFDKLKERFTPNLRTYTVLLNGWCRVKNLMEAGKTWNDIIDQGFKPDIIAHNVMLEGLLRSKKRSEAIKLFHVMKSKGPSPDVRSYTIMIRDFCKQSNTNVAVEYFDEMVETGLQPDAAVYTCLITGFGNRKRLDTVYELLREMQENGCPPDGKTYNALIKMMTSQKLPEHAARIYNKMIQNGIEPSIHTFNMIMKSYFQTRNYEMGRAVWDEMMKKGICPDDNSYTVLIRGLISEGKSREACRYLVEMLDKGMKTPQIDYNKFAADFYRAGKPEIFEELAQKTKFAGKFGASEIFSRWAQMTRRKFKRRFAAKVDGRCS